MKYSPNKNNIVLLLILTLSIFIYVLHGEMMSIIQEIMTAHLGWLFISVIFIVIYWCFEARTLYIMLRSNGDSFAYGDILKLVITTQFFNGITPFSTGGQPFQIYVLSRISQSGLGRLTSASIHNFIVYQVVLVLMGTFAIITKIFTNLLPGQTSQMTWVVTSGFILNLSIIFTLFIIAISPDKTIGIMNFILFIVKKTPIKKNVDDYRYKWTNTIHEFHSEIKSLFDNRRLFWEAFIINVLKLLSFYTIAYFICLAVGFKSISILQAIMASAYIMLLTSIIPLPGASLGAEFGFLVFFKAFIMGPQITAIMLLWRFVTYYFGLIIGGFTFYFGYGHID